MRRILIPLLLTSSFALGGCVASVAASAVGAAVSAEGHVAGLAFGESDQAFLYEILRRDQAGLLLQKLGDMVDGDFQTIRARGPKYLRDKVFGDDPEQVAWDALMYAATHVALDEASRQEARRSERPRHLRLDQLPDAFPLERRIPSVLHRRQPAVHPAAE